MTYKKLSAVNVFDYYSNDTLEILELFYSYDGDFRLRYYTHRRPHKITCEYVLTYNIETEEYEKNNLVLFT
jgi:hypothetical protein